METLGLNKIYYLKPECERVFRWDDALANPDDILNTHKFLTNTAKSDLDEIYAYMQAENWSPNGEAVELIKSLGLAHTSMSVGDLIEIDGIIYQVMPAGFLNLKTGEAI